MKTIKYSYQIALLGLLSIIISSFTVVDKMIERSYTPRDLYKYHLQGKILDKTNGAEIGGATVKVEHRHVELSNCPSGDDGSYTLKFESTIAFTGAELEYVITSNGYKDKLVPNIPIAPSVPKMVNFKMEPKPTNFRRDPQTRRWQTIEHLKDIERDL